MARLRATLHGLHGHCEERSDEAIHISACRAMDCFARNDGRGDVYAPTLYSAACCVGASSTSSTFGGDIGSA